MSCRLFLLPEASVPVSSLDAARAWLPSGGSSHVVLRGLRGLPVLSSPLAQQCAALTPPIGPSRGPQRSVGLSAVSPFDQAQASCSAPLTVLSTQGVLGKPVKQGPRSYTTQHPSRVAFLLSIWPGIWALGVGSSTEWIPWSLTSSGHSLPGVLFPVSFSVYLLNNAMARLSSLDNLVHC